MKTIIDEFKDDVSLCDIIKSLYIYEINGGNNTYFKAINVLKLDSLTLENSEDLFVFLINWAGQHKRKLANLTIEQKQTILNNIISIKNKYTNYNSLDILTVDLTNKNIIDFIEDCIKIIQIPKIIKDVMGIKLLSLIFPKLFVIYDNPIKEYYSLYYKTKKYINFLETMQIIAKNIKQKYELFKIEKNIAETSLENYVSLKIYENNSTLTIAKIIDEFNWIRITKKMYSTNELDIFIQKNINIIHKSYKNICI